ncbi:hypothetical protein [Massilia scottii]|uniref:hypothetical protein n=1 Tax=Massilia scottii TaxID=3057166 RepID=UPI002796D50A|nr:hypothetical protein [Massilia sp. CCM 9029]MDQ1829237.1 hypothetical protein [Massilia sp. CCM 9029]
MPVRPHSTAPEGVFIVMQQRGRDRVLFEVNAGKMVSIRVAPPGTAGPENMATEQAMEHSRLLMDTKGSC